jgi:hypothetical protein
MYIQKITYARPYDETFQASLESIKRLGWKLVSQNKETGEIEAKTGTSLRSWGEDISIQLVRETTGTAISVASGSSFQLFGWGKNEENEKIFNIELKKVIQR